MLVKGFASSATGHAYARARELWEQLGSPAEFLHIPYELSRYHVYRGELGLAIRLDEDSLHLSRQTNDSAGLVLGHFSSGRDLMLIGRFVSSRSGLDTALTLYDPCSHRSLVRQAAVHPQVIARAYLRLALLCLGYPDQALAESNAAITGAQRLSHWPSSAVALGWGTTLSIVADTAVLGERLEQLIAIAAEPGFLFWRAYGTMCRGWVTVKNGDVAEGISILRSGLATYRATGANLSIPYFFALLAKACTVAGQAEEAFTLLDEALDTVARTGARWFAAEMYRQKGELLQRQAHFEESEELYRKARSIAEEQQAKLWE